MPTPLPRGALTSSRLVRRPFVAAPIIAVGLALTYLLVRTPLLDLARVFHDNAEPRHITNLFLAGGAIVIGGLFVLRYGLIALVIVPFVVGPFWPGDQQPNTGDEPHYLVIADSVVRDHDLAVINNYGRPGAPPYEGHLSFDQAHNRPSAYSVHQPGTGVLVAPGWAIAERRGAQFVIAIVAALLLREMVLAGELLGASRRRATIAAALIYLTPAVFLMARTAFSEIPVALLLAHLFRRSLEQERKGPATWFATATAMAAAAAMPWFHLRFVVMAGLLAATFVIGGRGLRRFAPLAALGASGLLVLAAFDRWYGSPSPSALYGRTDGHLRFPTWNSLIGLLVDSHAGIVFVAPVAVLACMAVVPAWRRAPRVMTVAAVGAFASYLLDASWSHWWLDTATPGRFWVALLPLTAPLLAVAWPRVARPVKLAFVCVSTLAAVAYLAAPFGAYPNGSRGETLMWSYLGLGHVVPTLIDNVGTTPVPFAALLAAALVATAVVLATRFTAAPERRASDVTV